MLTVKNLSIVHRADERVLMRDVSFTAQDGEKIALIGEEGNGKSTLLAALHDPALVADFADISGLISHGTGENRSLTAYLAQTLSLDDAAKSVWAFVSASDAFYNADPREIAQLCRVLDLDADMLYEERKMETCSGGEKVKIRLLTMLLQHPDILLLDEPSNDLDLATLVWLESFIRDAKETVIFISHDEVLLETCADTIIHIEQIMRKTEPKVTIARCGYREYAEKRLNLIEKSAEIAKNEQKRFDEKMTRYRHIYERVHHEQNKITRQNPSGGRLLK